MEDANEAKTQYQSDATKQEPIQAQSQSPPLRPSRQKATEIAARMVPPSTVNREAKILARAKGKAPTGLDVESEGSPSIVVLMLRAFMQELSYDAEMASQYRKFSIFLVYTILLLVVISMQRHVGVKSIRDQYLALHDKYFDFGESITHDSAEEPSDRMQDFTAVQRHLREVILPTIFQESDCGNNKCDRPDEYPTWAAGDDARTFPGCASDCGNVDTTNVTVRFFDPWKIKHAVDFMTALSTESSVQGFSPREWGVLDGKDDLIAVPTAGWNICHKTDREQGYLVTVCIFDGDVTIDTFPFRTAELNASSSFFGLPKRVQLYEGEWELRLGYQNFAWRHPETGEDVQFAFPAVRGEICIENPVTGIDNCQIWDPCPQADECLCEYIDNQRVCFDEMYWSSFNVTTMLHDPPPASTYLQDHPQFAAYGFENSISAIGTWWRLQRSPDVSSNALPEFWTERNPPPFLSGGEQVDWSRQCREYTLLLLNPDLEGSWDPGDKLAIWTASTTLDVYNSTQHERSAARGARAYERTFSVDDSGCASWTVLLCDDRQYIFGVAEREDANYMTRGEAMAYSLVDQRGNVVFRGNAAWTYELKNATFGFTCPSDEFRNRECFDQNRSFCVWDATQDGPVFCDPTEDYTDREKAIFAFGADGLDFNGDDRRFSGRYCQPAADCLTFLQEYSGLSDAVACDIETLQEWRTASPTTADEILMDFDDVSIADLDVTKWPLVDEVRHVACAFTDAICDGWIGDSGWRWNLGTTTTDWTGPGVDSDPDFLQAYVYAESSGIVGNTSFHLEFVNFTLTQPSMLTFDYHMYGHRMGSLTVEAIMTDGLDTNATVEEILEEFAWTPLWRQEFNQMPRWHRGAAVSLDAGTIAIRFAAHAYHQTSDIAIDNVAIRNFRNNSATRPPTTEGEICARVVMYNDNGVGWSSANYQIEGAGFLERGTLNEGSIGSDTVCFPTGSGCYLFDVSAASDANARLHWELVVPTGRGGGEYVAISGGTPDTRSFIVSQMDIFESACTLSPTFSPAPTTSMAPTCDARILLELRDSFGDGYEGAEFSLARNGVVISTGTLESGFFSSQLICLPDAPACFNFTMSEDNRPSEVSWGIYLPRERTLLLNGSAPFSGAIVVNDDSRTGGSGATCAEALEAAAIAESVPVTAPSPSSGTAPPEPGSAPTVATSDSSLSSGNLRCYTSWRLPRRSENVDLESFWQNQPGNIATCQPDDKCVMVEYAWPPTEMEEYFAESASRGLYPVFAEETKSFIGLGGCKSDFTILAGDSWETCMNQLWWDFAPPSACIECDTDLCNSRPLDSRPSWYSNVFGVTAISLYHSMDWIVDVPSRDEAPRAGAPTFLSPDGTSVCSVSSVQDETCDLASNTLGCNYDEFRCCGDPSTGCSAPWSNVGTVPSWIYGYSTSEQVHATVPYTLHRAVKDKLMLHLEGDPINVDEITWNQTAKGLGIHVPSMACPECSTVTSKGWRAIDFNVTVPWSASMTTNPENNSMFPRMQPGDLRIRHFSDPNVQRRVVLYGPLLTQLRAKLNACPTNKLDKSRIGGNADRDDFIDALRWNQERLNLGCSTTASRLAEQTGDTEEADLIDLNTEQFGVDPTFDDTNPLYRPGNVARDFYAESEIRVEAEIPYLFQLRMQRAGTSSVKEKARHSDYEWSLQEQKYPHSYPIFFDVNTNVSRALEILETIVDGGYFDQSTDQVSVTLMLFNPQTETFAVITSTYTAGKGGAVETEHDINIIDVSYYSTDVDMGRFFLEFCVVCLLSALLYIEVMEMYDTVREYGSLLPYILDFSNFIDVLGYAFQSGLLFLWTRAVLRCNRFRPAASYYVHDELAEGRIVQAQRDTHRAQRVMDELLGVKAALDEYELFATISIISLSMQCLKSLRFHPTFGLVSATIVNMSSKVMFWFILLILVVGCYAVLGSLLFGHENGDYSSFATSAVTLLAALSGMYDYTTLSLEDPQDQLYFWTYMFLAFFVLLNVLLAIIVEGYDSSVATLKKRDPLGFFIRASLGGTRARGCLMPASTLVRILRKAIKVLGSEDLDGEADADDNDGADPQGGKSTLFSLQLKRKLQEVVALQRRRSVADFTYDQLVEYLNGLPKLRMAVARLPDWEKDLKLRKDVGSLVYAWKPASDEETIALDYPLIRLALRSITPGAPKKVLDIWAVVAINIISRFGLEKELTESLRDAESTTAEMTAVSRLLEIHRIVDLDTTAEDPSVNVRRVVAAAYNYAQGRSNSLVEYSRSCAEMEENESFGADVALSNIVMQEDEDLYKDIVLKLDKVRQYGGTAALKDIKVGIESMLEKNTFEQFESGNLLQPGDLHYAVSEDAHSEIRRIDF